MSDDVRYQVEGVLGWRGIWNLGDFYREALQNSETPLAKLPLCVPKREAPLGISDVKLPPLPLLVRRS